MKGSFYLCSQITEGVENSIPLHIRVDIPTTIEKGSDLPSEAVLRENL
jgi:hypothetical protein